MISISPEQQKKLEKIRAFVFDIDGTLTDGGVGICGSLEGTVKFYDIKDGSGCAMLRRSGIACCALTGRADACNRRRCQELRFAKIKDGCLTKGQGMRELCQEMGFSPEECLYMGDDLIDLPAIAMAGLSACPADAVEEIRQRVDFVMTKNGGHGAVREMVDIFLKATGRWAEVIRQYEEGDLK